MIFSFVNVTDRFLAELSPVALGQVPKDSDMKYENLVKGIRHIQIKVCPIDIVSKIYDIDVLNRSGLPRRLKTQPSSWSHYPSLSNTHTVFV